MFKVVFDLDGTLYKCDLALRKSLISTGEILGVEIPESVVFEDFIGVPVAQFSDRLRSLCPKNLADRFEETVLEQEYCLIPKEGVLYEGVLETLEKLYGDGHKLYLCSNGTERYVRRVVKTFNLERLFGDICFQRDNTFRKKSSLIREMLNDRLQNLIIVGDRQTDIEAGRELGAVCVAAKYGYATKNESLLPDYYIDSFKQFIEVINRISVKSSRLIKGEAELR